LYSISSKWIFFNNYKAKFYFMPVKIRLQRKGRKQRPFYYIVVADSRTTRNGKFIERIGDYNPLTVPATINLDADKAFKWVMDGAQPTETVSRILTFRGVLYRKHLLKGVAKGAFTQEEADAKYNAWVEAKKSKVQDRISKEIQKIEDKRTKRNAEESEKRTAKLVAKEAEAAPAEEEVVEEATAEEATETQTEESTEVQAEESTEETSAE